MLRRGAKRWAERELSTGCDLGIVLLRELTRTYASTGDELLGWMTAWELAFYGGDTTRTHEPLKTLRGLGAEFGARLNAMDRAADGERGNWFSPAAEPDCATARFSDAAHENLDDALADVDRLNDMLRGSLELMLSREMAAQSSEMNEQSKNMAEQLKLQQMQAEQTKQLESTVARITSLFLVPSLIAAFFGANTALPGGNGAHAWSSFGLMIALMVLSAAGAWFGMKHLNKTEPAAAPASPE